MTAIAEWSAATKQYGAVTAVRGVSLALQAGEAVALVGHNGAGKTTLIKLLLGLIRPTAGTVRLLGNDPATRSGAQSRGALGFLPENIAFHGSMTGVEVMDFYARLKRWARSRNRDLLKRVGLAEAADRRVATYSKGMRQRLGIAQTLIGDPRLLVLDEPTSGLDPSSRSEVFSMIGKLRAAGTTILISTHALAEVEHFVDRVAMMHKGKLVAASTMAELRNRVAAEAQIALHVRPCTTGKVLARLGDLVRCEDRSLTTLRLAVSQADKMSVISRLAEMNDLISDIEMTTPGLEHLYHRFVQNSGGGQ